MGSIGMLRSLSRAIHLPTGCQAQYGSCLMSLSASPLGVWKLKGLRSRFIGYWGLLLILNFALSVIFFGLHSIAGALIEIAILLLLILRTIVAFSAVDRFAGLLLVPYFCWTAFAAILNAAI
jgi:benzodiazapine receptor